MFCFETFRCIYSFRFVVSIAVTIWNNRSNACWTLSSEERGLPGFLTLAHTSCSFKLMITNDKCCLETVRRVMKSTLGYNRWVSLAELQNARLLVLSGRSLATAEFMDRLNARRESCKLRPSDQHHPVTGCPCFNKYKYLKFCHSFWKTKYTISAQCSL